MDPNRDAYSELYVYTMGRGRESFVLQHVVDAYAAQSATDGINSIGLVFALVGLYLHVEQRFSGTQVQRVHMLLARRKRQWPTIVIPDDRGGMTAADVLAAPAGADRDAAIDAWCRSVWVAFQDNRQAIVDMLREYDIT